MENEVCQFSKYGYCKYKESCIRIHYTQECQALDECNIIKTCERRHPKICKKFSNGNICKFGNGCAYSHNNSIQKQEPKDLKDKVLVLEKTVSLMNIKLNYLENELKEVKKENVAKAKVDNEVKESKNTENNMKVKISVKEVADKVKKNLQR